MVSGVMLMAVIQPVPVVGTMRGTAIPRALPADLPAVVAIFALDRLREEVFR
ncbi:hypothetical protein Pve01_83580 [Planomonospora venezuelensis]|nr:hypothetical protein Pve01_83580 [Planomonospora venezuelensis]